MPLPGWLDAYRRAFTLGERVGAAYGPHLPLEGTSPMIARELAEFFAAFAPNGHPVLQGPGDPVFLSNVNACYRRDCWEEIRFPDVPYAEDQAFARAMLAAGWTKVYEPGAAVLHAHDYGPVEFMRRYFDEYRGLRETLGHVEPLTPRSVAGRSRGGRWPPTAAGCASARGPPAGARAGPRARRSTIRPGSCSPAWARAPTACPPACGGRSRSKGGPARRPARGRWRPRLAAPLWEEVARLSKEGPAAARGAGARDGGARAAPRGGGHPRVRPRQRRPQLDLPDRPLARADGPHLLAVGVRPAGPERHRAGVGAAAPDRLRVRAAPGSGVQGLRRVARGRRGGGHRAGRPSTRRCCCPAAAPAPTSCTTTSRSSSAPRSSGSGRSGPTTRTSTRSRAASGCSG